MADLINDAIPFSIRGLIETCRFFHAEVSGYFFKHTTFQLTLPRGGRNELTHPEGWPLVHRETLRQTRRLQVNLQVYTEGYEDHLVWELHTSKFAEKQQQQLQNFVRLLCESKSVGDWQGECLLDSMVVVLNVCGELDLEADDEFDFFPVERSMYMDTFKEVKESLGSFKAENRVWSSIGRSTFPKLHRRKGSQSGIEHSKPEQLVVVFNGIQ